MEGSRKLLQHTSRDPEVTLRGRQGEPWVPREVLLPEGFPGHFRCWISLGSARNDRCPWNDTSRDLEVTRHGGNRSALYVREVLLPEGF